MGTEPEGLEVVVVVVGFGVRKVRVVRRQEEGRKRARLIGRGSRDQRGLHCGETFGREEVGFERVVEKWE